MSICNICLSSRRDQISTGERNLDGSQTEKGADDNLSERALVWSGQYARSNDLFGSVATTCPYRIHKLTSPPCYVSEKRKSPGEKALQLCCRFEKRSSRSLERPCNQCVFLHKVFLNSICLSTACPKPHATTQQTASLFMQQRARASSAKSSKFMEKSSLSISPVHCSIGEFSLKAYVKDFASQGLCCSRALGSLLADSQTAKEVSLDTAHRKYPAQVGQNSGGNFQGLPSVPCMCGPRPYGLGNLYVTGAKSIRRWTSSISRNFACGP